MARTNTETLQPSDSIDSQDPQNEGKDKKAKSRRPANTAFRQQRLKAWQPILTPKTVLPLFFLVGVIFAPIGGLLLWASSKVEEIQIDYSDCTRLAPYGNFETIPSNRVSSHFNRNANTSDGTAATWRAENITVSYGTTGAVKVPTTRCTVQFQIENDIGPPVLFYYRLTNFYQNHRRYVKSLDMSQLEGHFRSNDSIKSSDCDPLDVDSRTGKAYYPCGLIANSLFNDTFANITLLNPSGGAQNVTYNFTNQDISWNSDRDLYGKTEYTNDQVVPPRNWVRRYANASYNDETPIPDLHEDGNFHNWMRTAGLPTFAKLALRNDREVMRAGRYQIDIYDDFPVTAYGGTKSILISTRTVMGGKNPFMGITYIIVGGICIVLGAIFTATHIIKPRKLGDHTYLTWNNEPSTATATGRQARPTDAA